MVATLRIGTADGGKSGRLSNLIGDRTTAGQDFSRKCNEAAFLFISLYRLPLAFEGVHSSSFRASGAVLLVQHLFHFAHELRRKEWFFQNVCSALDQFIQFGKIVSKASDK